MHLFRTSTSESEAAFVNDEISKMQLGNKVSKQLWNISCQLHSIFNLAGKERSIVLACKIVAMRKP